MNEQYLQHHGILGQKWGIRRFQPYPSGERVKGGKEVGAATKVKQRGTVNPNYIKRLTKKTEKQIEKTNKLYDNAKDIGEQYVNKQKNKKLDAQIKLRNQGPGINNYREKRIDKIDKKIKLMKEVKKWDEQERKDELRIIKEDYNKKLEKKQKKADIKETTKYLNKNASIGDKLLFNDATRKLTAKLIVNNNMTYEEARKKANKVTIANTAAALAVVGGYVIKNRY